MDQHDKPGTLEQSEPRTIVGDTVEQSDVSATTGDQELPQKDGGKKTARIGRPKGSGVGNKHSKQAISNRQTRQILDMKSKGLSAPQIARAVHLSERAVWKRLAKFKGTFKELDNVADYEANKSPLLSAAELVVLKSMVREDKLDEASVNNLAYAYTQLNMANRLHKGLSTSNVSSSMRFVKLKE